MEKSIDVAYYKNVFPRKRELLIKKVSRTFALSIRILPPALRAYTGHAYLICRLLDSIEDAPDLPIAKKREALDIAIESLSSFYKVGENSTYFTEIASQSRIKKWEKVLLTNSADLFGCFAVFPENIWKITRKWAAEMAKGMKKYAFGKDKPGIRLKTIAELDEYTYYVAGTVGNLLTDMFSRREHKIPIDRQKIMYQNAVQFGKALQLVNIIKDSRVDITEGRCYVPEELFRKYNSDINSFSDSRDTDNIKCIFLELIRYAEKYLEHAIEYIRAIPTKNWRIRLGCIWPVALAYKTLWWLEKNLDEFIKGSTTFKINRKDVKKTIRATLWAGFSNKYFETYVKKIIPDRV
jgi:farnesyl-diphosphate farnesyltransferase